MSQPERPPSKFFNQQLSRLMLGLAFRLPWEPLKTISLKDRWQKLHFMPPFFHHYPQVLSPSSLMRSTIPIRHIALALITLLGSFSVSCDKSNPIEDHTDTSLDLHLELKLIQSTSSPTIEEISPYDEALVVNEYQVLKVLNGEKPSSDKIRVAQWAITGKQILPLPNKKGDLATLYLTPLSAMPELNSLYQRNDLDFDPEEDIYYDLTPLPETYTPPKIIRSDYRSDVARRLQVFWLIRQQLKLAVLGNSHSAAAVDPQKFYQPGNNDVPVAINFSPAGSGIPFQTLLANQYLSECPELKWVLWGISPRVFNQRFAIDRRAQLFQNSPGYTYDRQHWQQLLQQAPPSPVTFHQIRDTLNSKVRPWGWAKKKNRDFAVPLSEDTRKKLLQHCQIPNFKWNADAWTSFQQAVEKLSHQNIKVLLFIPPYHPLVAQTPVADGDDTGNADYEKIVAKLSQLSQKTRDVYFLDTHQGGKHGFQHQHFSDIDHLHISGAQLLTQQLVEFVTKVEQPEP